MQSFPELGNDSLNPNELLRRQPRLLQAPNQDPGHILHHCVGHIGFVHVQPYTPSNHHEPQVQHTPQHRFFKSQKKTRAKAKSAIGAVYQLSYPTAVDTNAPLTKTSSQLPKKYHETI